MSPAETIDPSAPPAASGQRRDGFARSAFRLGLVAVVAVVGLGAILALVHAHVGGEGRSPWGWDAVLVALAGLTLASIAWLAWSVARVRRQEQEAARTASRLQTVLSNAPVVLFGIDRDGRITLSVGHGLEKLGLREGQHVGQSVFELYRDVPIVSDSVRRALAGEEVNVTVPVGSRVFDARYQPRRDASGAIAGVIGVATDVTERVRAEEERTELDSIVENSADCIGMTGPDGRVRYLNAAGLRMAGAAVPADVLDRPWSELHPADEEPRVREALAAVTRSGHWSGELNLGGRPGGSPIPASFNFFAIRSPATAEVIAHGVIARDMTDRRRAEDERREMETQALNAQKMESLGALAGGIAHDFNNLLAGVLGNAGLARSELPPGSPAMASLEQIETAAVRAAELANQMLAYSGRGRVVTEPVDFTRLIEDMAPLLRAVPSKKAVLKLNLADDLPPVDADAAQLRQVVMSLVTNASDALCDASGVIMVSTGLVQADRAYLAETVLGPQAPEGAHVFLEVSDTGCGMDAGTISRIFEPFFSTKFAGRGLGLSSVLGIVRGHHGAIKVQSTPGRGSTFKVLFPAQATKARTAARRRSPAVAHPAARAILVADDEHVVRSVASTALAREGFEVLQARDGQEAIDTFRANADRVGVVLLDLTMPRMDGREVLHELRRIRPDVRVVLSSGYDEQQAADAIPSDGIASFLKKPYRMAELLATVRAALGT